MIRNGHERRNEFSLLAEMNEEKTKILRWVIQWLKYPTNNSNNNAIDTLELVSLLQCLGFNLDSYKKSDTEANAISLGQDINITITCKKSSMVATMSKDLCTCNCPTDEVATNAQMWSISGCAPNTDRINTSNSSIIPSLSPTKNKVMGELLQKVLQTIYSPERCSVDQTNIDIAKEEPPSNLQKLDCSPETDPTRRSVVTKQKSEEVTTITDTKQPPLFEIEGPASPPKSCSSPLPELSSRFGLPGSEERVRDLLKSIMQLSEEAYNVAMGHNTTYPKGDRRKRISDIKVSPLASGEMPIAGNFINLNITRTKDFSLLKTKTPLKGIAAKKPAGVTPSGSGKKMLPPVSSKYGIARAKAMTPTTRTPTVQKPQTPHNDTPRPGSAKDLLKSKLTKYVPSPTTNKVIKIPGGENSPAGISRLRPPGKLPLSKKK